MKSILLPAPAKLSLAIVPAITVLIMIPVIQAVPVWAVAVWLISAISYFGFLQHYCVRQKCLEQLLLNGIALMAITIILCVMYCANAQ